MGNGGGPNPGESAPAPGKRVVQPGGPPPRAGRRGGARGAGDLGRTGARIGSRVDPQTRAARTKDAHRAAAYAQRRLPWFPSCSTPRRGAPRPASTSPTSRTTGGARGEGCVSGEAGAGLEEGAL